MKALGIIILVLLGLSITFFESKAQQPQSGIEVIQFHSEHRCVTCVQIEKITRATLEKNFKSMPFTLVNVDDTRNASRAEQFEATGTALFLFNSKTGKKKDLTEFAFMNAFDEKEFESELKKIIEDFIKS